MKPTKLRIPTPVHHKPSGQDVVFLRQPDGSRRTIYLGPHGSAEATANYRAVASKFLAGQEVRNAREAARAASEWPKVSQLCAAFLLHCDRYYVDEHGNRSSGIANFVQALKPFLRLLRDLPTDRLDVPNLELVRQSLIDQGKCNRTTINAKMRRIRQCIRWGVERQLVPGAAWHEVSAMKGLPPGRAGVREPSKVEAVPRRWVESILPHLATPLAAAVELQWWSGARPSEILQLTRERLTFGDVWEFRPPAHKGRWKGQDRVIRFGPEAQRILAPLLKLEPQAAILSPRDALAEQSRARAEQRKSKETPSQRARRERNARKPPSVGEFYNINSYRKAIHRACDTAGIPRWSPHRLRHAAGTRIFLDSGSIEASRVALGHADDRVTRRYAVAAESELARQVMGRHG